MTKIKLCGLTRPCDIEYVNELMPEYIGFVFYKKSRRYLTFHDAAALRAKLSDGITPVGVFVNETIENIKYLADNNIIDTVQLHGSEDNIYIGKLRQAVTCPIIQAFRIAERSDIERAVLSKADFIMLDSGGGTGEEFDHSLINGIKRDFFLAGGLDSQNVYGVISKYAPYAVDASSSLETDGVKDMKKMTDFVTAARYGKDNEK